VSPTPDSYSAVAVVREFALAWQKLSLYQPGHPMRGEGIRDVHKALAAHLAHHGPLALGVSRQTLLGPGGKLDSEAARKLASALHRRGVALIRFDHGIRIEELKTLLEFLPQRAGTGTEIEPWSAIASATPHIHTEHLDFSDLVEPTTAELTAIRLSLWDRVLERLLKKDDEEAELSLDREPSLDEVIQAIQALLRRYSEADSAAEGGGVPPYVFAFINDALRSAVAGHLAAAPLPEASGYANRVGDVAQLLQAVPVSLQGSILDAALPHLLSEETQPEWLLLIARAVTPAVLVACLRRLLGDGFALAPETLHQLEALIEEGAYTWVAGGGPPRQSADALHELFADHDVDRIHPPAGEAARTVIELLKPRLDHPIPSQLDDRLDTLSEQQRAVGVAIALVELLQRALLDEEQAEAVATRLDHLFHALLASGAVHSALRIAKSLQQLPTSVTSPARKQTLERHLEVLSGGATIDALVDSLAAPLPATRQAIDQLIDTLGAPILSGLLLALGEEKDRSRRRRIFDLLASLGPRITPHISNLLADRRWFVVRNMLTLLHRTGHGLSPELVEWALQHPESRVRLEGVKCLATLGGATPSSAIERALADSEPKVAEATVAAVATQKIASGRDPLVAFLQQSDRLGRQRALRIQALRALGQLGDPAALPGIRHLFRGLLGGTHADERRAAYASLAFYPQAARQPFVDGGLRSTDGQVRAISARLKADAKRAQGGKR